MSRAQGQLDDGDGLACGNTDACFGGEEEWGFVGPRSGDFKKEVTYRYVGEGEGTHNKLEQIRRPSPFGCLCLLGSLFVFAGVVFLNLNGAGGGAAAGGADAASDGASYHCDPRAMNSGEKVQAAFDIAFRPAGFVAQGSPGTVAAVMPSDDRHVVVDWRDFPQLQGSKVSRSQILRVLGEGDEVEVLQAVTLEPPEHADEALRTDDLVLAADNIDGHVPQGTFGYISKVLSVKGADRFKVSFPEMPEFDGLQVGRTDLIKAPRAGDRIKALVDIDAGVLGSIMKGTPGRVLSMHQEKATYVYQVGWEGYPVNTQSVQVKGISLEVVTDMSRPAAVHIPKGSLGKIVSAQASGLADAKLGVVFKDFSPDHVALTRSQVVKAPNWPKERREYCCRTAKVGCTVAVAAAAAAEEEEEEERQAQPDPFTCSLGSQQAWSEGERSWCCAKKNIGCSEAATTAAPTAAPEPVQPVDPSEPASKPLWDCHAKGQWVPPQQNWCCQYENLGCQPVHT